MELKYKTTPKNLGGAAVTGAGTIHKSEVRPTLEKLSKALNFPFDLNDFTIGSTGKVEYSGDIDLVIDNKWWTEGPGALREMLESRFGADSISRNANMLHLCYPIEEYKSTLKERLPRTGYVQVDFNLGDPEWEKFYHYSPGSNSGYKGLHRHIAISSITAVVGVEDLNNNLMSIKPVCQNKWKFSVNGFVKVFRCSVKDERTGVWLKKPVDTIIEGPYFDADIIAKKLFNTEQATADDLESLETIVDAVKRYCGLVEKEQIWMKMASNFRTKSASDFEYPPEITKYIL